MERKSEEPRRVTPTEARAKLLQSLIREMKSPVKEADQEKLNEVRLNFIRQMANDQSSSE